MENADYVRYLIRNNESIYIDTASLMDVCELELFISNIRNVLLSSNRKIIVPRAVCLELTKHLGSNSVDKREKALRAMSLLSTHSDLFDLDNDNLQESEVYKAFADSELLAKMTVNMKFVGQLLITNDKRLSQDAFDLNNLASCRGHKIMVCYINRSGELHMCECVRDFNHQPLRVATDHNFYNQECSNTNHVEEKSDESKDYDSKYFTAKSLFIPVSMLLISIITKKYSRSTYRIIKSLF